MKRSCLLLSAFLLSGMVQINTSNPGKLAEYREYFGQVVAETKDLHEPKADPLTIIQYKASQFNGVLVDDVALDIEGVDVGVNIRWFLKDLPRYIGKKATFCCLIAINVGDEVKVYRGAVDGLLVEPRGDGFGFGPYFLPIGADKTLGEYMDLRFNARYLAIENFKQELPFVKLPLLREWDGEFQD